MTVSEISLLGLGAMGRELAVNLVQRGHRVTVWNRTPQRAEGLRGAGAHVATDVEEAVRAAPLVVACLLDDASVREQLEPVAPALAGCTLVNVTTSTPDEARRMATWSAEHHLTYVDGGIMATPDLIGGPASLVLYSGDQSAFEQYRGLLEVWGRAEYVGADPGAAAMYDTALLGTMYAMFAGFAQGGRMVRSAGGSADHLASLAAPFLSAMTAGFDEAAAGIDTPQTHLPTQSDEFTRAAVQLINRSAVEAGQQPDLLDAAQALLTEPQKAGAPS